LEKSFIAITVNTGIKVAMGWEGLHYVYICALAAYLLAEIGLGTGGGHFESTDCPR
jgi:hypothetical protein